MQRNVSVIILYDDKKRILLQHRSDDATYLPGYWAFFGGGIEPGETPEQAVRREAIEELQYTLTNPVLAMKQVFAWGGDNHEKYVYIERYDPSKELILGEGQDLRWFYYSELDSLKIVDHDTEVLRNIIDTY